jgi:Zn-dependent peptidase ImmA (M78 family)
MQSFFDKISKLGCGWNEVPLGEDSFHRLCERHRIGVRYMPLTVNGFYTCAGGRHYIAIDRNLGQIQTLFVMYHEFGHYLMHTPSTDAVSRYCGSRSGGRDEREADAFAYCAIVPVTQLRDRDGEELADMYGNEFYQTRLDVYERYGL